MASVHLSKVNKVTVAALSNFLEGFKNKRPGVNYARF